MRLGGRAVRNGANAVCRPSVVVADDHVGVLQSVSRLLAEDFDVLAAVGDGRQAVEAVQRFDPDALVIDITMPLLDGFQTARELQRIGSRTRVVFLTMHKGEEYVAAAMGVGAYGYVLKTRIHADLPGALRHSLEGRLFAPSLASVATVAQALGGCGHVVHFRSNDHSLSNELSELLGAALERGDLTAVVATETTRNGIAQRLKAKGADAAARQGRYLSLDATEALSRCLHDGRLDANRVREMVDDLERTRAATLGASRLTIFGEISVLLLQDGNVEAALQLERLWNQLTRRLPFLTVCSYPTQCCAPAGRPDVFQAICAEHGAISHA
jgi:DNA-binding NarL/FixJ family response regulator